MRALLFLGVLAFALGAAPARADGIAGGGDDDHHHCPHCNPETKEVCFNLVCHYDFDEDHDQDHHRRHCTAAATFKKRVTEQGGEVSDNSKPEDDVKLEVKCEDDHFDPRPGRRFTDLLGTRLQGEQGPTPAILLPRSELHTGPGDKNSGHYSKSVLELDTNKGFRRGEGECFIWTGFP